MDRARASRQIGASTTWAKSAASRRLHVTLVAAGLVLASSGPTAARTVQGRPSVVLLTLDTTRADFLGCYGSARAETPSLDALAARGTLYRKALTASPLTLPAHATLLTGLEPPEHGLRDNGTATLDASLSTLATVFAAGGYATGAFVSSRVLDRRFGLDAGFEVYDDRMAAERLGEYGYPERDAAAVTSAAIDWLSSLDLARPYFLWVHYYDPHAPYEPPARWRTGSARGNYAGEIAHMDQQIGRLLEALPGSAGRPVVAVVGDHGEALGEHGERGHGIFLYRASLEVPLVLAGPGVPAGRQVQEVVGTQRLPATLLRLLGFVEEAAELGSSLPGLPSLPVDAEARAVYSETWMPANAYGWSPLKAVTDQRWRLVVAPRPELYDLEADPDEERNLIAERRREAHRLKRALESFERSLRASPGGNTEVDPELAADLRSLGYLSSSRSPVSGIDPKDGIVLLDELAEAKRLLQAGEAGRAAAILRDLVRRNPSNIPFLTQLGAAELASGDGEAALAAYRRAASQNPQLDFLHLNLGRAHLQLGQREEAHRELELTLQINRRSAEAWLLLAELALRSGDPRRERRLLLDAVAAGTASAMIRTRLGQIELAAGDLAAADGHLRTAADLAPDLALVWLLWGDTQEARQRPAEALAHYRRAAALDEGNAAILLRLGRLELRSGAAAAGRAHLERVVALAPTSPEGREARRLLGAH